MKRRWVLHTLYWLAYLLIYAYTYSRYDGQFGKYLYTETLQMAGRILPTYFAFWLIDRLQNRSGWLALSGVAAGTIAGGFLNRFIKYVYLVPRFFPDAKIIFWDWRAMVDIFDVVLATGVALTARLFFRQQESLRREETLRAEKSAAELQALRNQVQPHFLFNTINNIYALARMKSDKTAEVALKLANLLRFVLYETRKTDIPLEQEVQILRDYIALEQLRFDADRLRVETLFEIENPLLPVTPLLLLPLVENAFKHGAGEQRDDAFVRVQIRQSGAQLECLVENSLPEQASPENSGGIGLSNVRRQLELLYPGKSSLIVEQSGDVFRVKLLIYEIDLRFEIT